MLAVPLLLKVLPGRDGLPQGQAEATRILVPPRLTSEPGLT